MDVFGGGSSTEALIGIAIGVIEAGMCKTVAIFRAMNGYTQVRIGGTGARSARAGRRRHAAQPRLWLAERRADVRADLHAPHVRLRHHAGAGGDREGGAQPPRLEQPEGLLQEALHGGGRAVTAASSASRCTCSTAASRPTTPPAIIVTSAERARDLRAHAGADPRRRRAGATSRGSTCTTSTGRSRPSPAITPRTSCGRTPASGPRTST